MSGERGDTITADFFSAAGVYIPPTLKISRKRMQQAFLNGIVLGRWVELNDRGVDRNETYFCMVSKIRRFF